jgi:hypothetical protein
MKHESPNAFMQRYSTSSSCHNVSGSSVSTTTKTNSAGRASANLAERDNRLAHRVDVPDVGVAQPRVRVVAHALDALALQLVRLRPRRDVARDRPASRRTTTVGMA